MGSCHHRNEDMFTKQNSDQNNGEENDFSTSWSHLESSADQTSSNNSSEINSITMKCLETKETTTTMTDEISTANKRTLIENNPTTPTTDNSAANVDAILSSFGICRVFYPVGVYFLYLPIIAFFSWQMFILTFAAWEPDTYFSNGRRKKKTTKQQVRDSLMCVF